MRIAFLGLGRMGAAMAAHLPADHQLTVCDRTPRRADSLREAGAREAGSVADAVRDAEAVVLMLSGPPSVRDVLPELAGAPEGALLVSCSTIGPADARAAAAAVPALRYVDAPVAGTVGPSRGGTLGVVGGADEQTWQDALPLLPASGDADKVRRVGAVGAGSAVPLCNDLALGPTHRRRRGGPAARPRPGPRALRSAAGPGRPPRSGRGWPTSGRCSTAATPAGRRSRSTGWPRTSGWRWTPPSPTWGHAGHRGRGAGRADAGHSGEDFAALAGFLADEGRADSY